jgi:hypothetical protein
MTSKKFHFKEIDWLIYVPAQGIDDHRVLEYGVAYRNRSTGDTQTGRRITLEDTLELPAIRGAYPHTVSLFEESFGRDSNWKPEYLETRVIRNEDELISWIEELDETRPKAISEPLIELRRYGEDLESNVHVIIVASGWVFIVASVVQMFIFLQSKTSFGQSIIDTIVVIPLLDGSVVVFNLGIKWRCGRILLE